MLLRLDAIQTYLDEAHENIMKEVIPEPSVIRLCLMYRFLEKCRARELKTVFSSDIGKGLGVTAHTVRKDISFLGEIGNTAAGYDVNKLQNHTHTHLGLGKKQENMVKNILDRGDFLRREK